MCMCVAMTALTFVPALISTVAFASFRGTLDIMTPLRIAIISNIVNVLLDPFMIFSMGMGVAGAAAATWFQLQHMCIHMYISKYSTYHSTTVSLR